MLQFSQFVWALSYSVWDVFNNFLLVDATDRSKISGDQKRFFSHKAYTPFHFSRTLPLTNWMMMWGLTILKLCSFFTWKFKEIIGLKIPDILKSYNRHPTLLPDSQSQILVPSLIAMISLIRDRFLPCGPWWFWKHWYL